MALPLNEVHQGDCVTLLGKLKPGSVDLVFADPPFNIGYEYDVYDDRRAAKDYLQWSRRWIAGVHRALKPDGTFWLAIGDEYAAELKLVAQNDVGFTCRSWVIWYYTFGVNCKRGFSRSHTHLFHFVKDPARFTFNADNPAIRVPSARQLVYGDGRANPKGRLPDNTWILRPQDLPAGFSEGEDTWYVPRVAGTFKEREGFHGCQMPEQLLGRIIRCCSNPLEVVLDPFGGSGTTLAVAKKLGRRWLGLELSADYVARIRQRLAGCNSGDMLDGASDPLTSVPATAQGRKLGSPRSAKTQKTGAKNKPAQPKRDDYNRAIIAAYRSVHAGKSVDYLLASPELNAAFLAQCRRKGIEGGDVDWNLRLVRLRKAGQLPLLERTSRGLTFQQMDPYSFASEIAMQQLSVEIQTTLDGILCNPTLAARFDEIAASFSPGYSPFEYRWAALSIRKRAQSAKRLAVLRSKEWRRLRIPAGRSLAKQLDERPQYAGVYLLSGSEGQPLYVGESMNLHDRLERLRDIPSWAALGLGAVSLFPDDNKPYGLQAFLIHRERPLMNSDLLVPKLGTAS